MSNNIPTAELTPELGNKIWNSIQKKIRNDKISKDAVLHHLKQLKAHMGKLKSQEGSLLGGEYAIERCMEIIDKKIDKIKKV